MKMGSETEFGIAGGWTLERAEAVQEQVTRSQSWLPSAKSGAFLANGARVYVDQRNHNEYATPETEDPADLVRCELAGRQLMAAAAQKQQLQMLCSNFDPATGNTWANHENYECRTPMGADRRGGLYPHLITRILFTGAGGLDPEHPGVKCVLSPRAARTVAARSEQGTLRKTLLYAKPDHYGAAERLHVFCGESLLSHLASYLKYATTALVVALVDAGQLPGSWPFAEAPVRILRQVNHDLSFERRFRLRNGRRTSALEVQWRYLEAAQTHLAILPAWAPIAMERWETVLQSLEAGDCCLAGKLDWLAYRQALMEFCAECDWDEGDLIQANRRAVAGQLTGDCARRLREIRAAAHELYFRLHILGPGSLFGELELLGRLDHRLPELSKASVTAATTTPPTGRSANRARIIREHAGKPGLGISWERCWDEVQCQFADIPDMAQWDGRLQWQPWLQQPQSDPLDRTPIETAKRLFSCGRYRDTLDLLETCRLKDLSAESLENLCLSRARMGLKAETLAALEEVRRRPLPRLVQIAMELFCRINFGLVPAVEDLLPLLVEGSLLLTAGEDVDSYTRFVFQQNLALVLTQRGEFQAAEKLFVAMLGDPDNLSRPRMTARTRCYHAELLRRMLRPAEALAQARLAQEAHHVHGLAGDTAAHSLPILAKLLPDAEATELLDQAEALARGVANPLVLARVLCLRSRRLKDAGPRADIFRLLNSVSVLRDCPVAARIREDWGGWGAEASPAPVADYWGL